MPLVNVMVNSRAYTIACDEGEEEHLRELATHVDGKVKELLGSVGHHDASTQLHLRTQELGTLSGSHEEVSGKLAQAEGTASDAFDAAAKRLEDMAARLA